MVPRETFDRNTNAELVVSALNSHEIGIPAYLNERHDIVVHGKKVSGSAYKIINKRAYHHGTMLIDAQLDRLGNLLRNTKTSLHTKGVESVRSPVANLVSFAPSITHDAFVQAVTWAFRDRYYPEEPEEGLVTEFEHGNETVDAGVADLQSWDWRFGQTPEFTHNMNARFAWGDVDVYITSKRGLITQSRVRGLQIPDDALVGVRYGTLDRVEESLVKSYKGPQNQLEQFISWLRLEM